MNGQYQRKPKPRHAPAHFDRWSPAQLADLAERRRNGATRAQLAEHFQRTPRAIKHKLHQTGESK